MIGGAKKVFHKLLTGQSNEIHYFINTWSSKKIGKNANGSMRMIPVKNDQISDGDMEVIRDFRKQGVESQK